MRSSTITVSISGIFVEITRKNIRTIRLCVLPPDGEVRISAPFGLSNYEIERFILDRIEWIRKHKTRIASKPKKKKREYADGETVPVFGKFYILRTEVAENKRNSVVLTETEAILRVQNINDFDLRKKVLKTFYRKILVDMISKKLPEWESKTGLKSSSITIREMKSCWGTCNTKTKKITLNLNLVEKPIEYLEYVILHELAHIIYRGHGENFKAYLTQYMPDWRERRKSLNALGINL